MDLQSSASEQGTAAVVDGARLLVTPLRIAAVPPPLSAVTLLASAPILCVGHRHGTPSEAHPPPKLRPPLKSGTSSKCRTMRQLLMQIALTHQDFDSVLALRAP